MSGLRDRSAGRVSPGARGPRAEAGTSGGSGEWREPIPHLLESRYSQSLERGLAILECFTPERPVWGIAELADELGMSRSTTHRYALTLTELGHLVRAPRRRYRLGLGVTRLGLSTLSSTSLRTHAEPHLEELSRRVPYTLAIAVLDGPEVLYVDSLRASRRGQYPVDLGLDEGSRLPAHCTAIGKLLLANLPAPEQRELIAKLELKRRGPCTITSRTALRRELEQILEDGLATGNEELAPGLYEIAAPVRSQARELLAGVSLLAHRSTISLEQLVEHLGPHLISTADRISAQVGFRREDERAVGAVGER
jgi:IclR family transcriptional regulator, pca regulon regulatory protein